MAAETQEDRDHRLDAIDVMDLLHKCVVKKTTTQKDFVNHMKDGRSHKPDRIFKYQTDGALISGHTANNLKVNKIEMKTRTWPYAVDWREEYRQFLKRTKWCNEEIYDLFFKCPPVRYDQVADYLIDLRRTVYGSDYSPNGYESLRSQRTIDLNDKSRECDSKDRETTYGNYYNRLEELQRCGNAPHQRPGVPHDLTLEKFLENMRKLYRKYGLTTYYEQICLPSILKSKDGKMPSRPIDRYTLRRV